MAPKVKCLRSLWCCPRSSFVILSDIPFSFGDVVRNMLLALLLLPVLSHADAYKCKEPNGKIVVTSVPCEDSLQLKSIPNAGTSQSDYNRAQSDLERQKTWLRNRQVEQVNDSRLSQAVSVQDNHGNTEQIHACLMAVTATSGLTPYTAGSRRVECYRGTKGRSTECEASVAGTPRLNLSEEANLQACCRSM